MDFTFIEISGKLISLVILYAFVSVMGLFAFAVVKRLIHKARQKDATEPKMLYEFVGQEITAKRISIITIVLTIVTAVPMLVNIRIKNRQAKENFAQIFTECTKLVIRTGPTYHRTNDEAPILVEVTTPQQIVKIKPLLVVEKLLKGGCSCAGDLTFEIYEQDGLRHSFTLHHGETLRLRDRITINLLLSESSQISLKNWLDNNQVYEQIKDFP